MNRRELLAAAGLSVGALAIGQEASADDGSVDFTRTWNTEDFLSDGPFSYYTSVILWDTDEGADVFFKMMKANFLESLVENLEGGGSTVEAYDSVEYEFTDIIFKNAKGTIIKAETAGFVMYVQDDGIPLMQLNGLIAQSDRCVHCWFASGMNDNEKALIELAEETMKFSAKKKGSLPNMIPDERDMPGYDLNDEGFGDEDE